MGFWNKLFGKKKREGSDPSDWDKLVYLTDGVNFNDREQRNRYVAGCLEGIRRVISKLILRRQTLRKQLDYNKNAAEAAHQQVLEISRQYPEYSGEILDMVEKYQRESERIS